MGLAIPCMAHTWWKIEAAGHRPRFVGDSQVVLRKQRESQRDESSNSTSNIHCLQPMVSFKTKISGGEFCGFKTGCYSAAGILNKVRQRKTANFRLTRCLKRYQPEVEQSCYRDQKKYRHASLKPPGFNPTKSTGRFSRRCNPKCSRTWFEIPKIRTWNHNIIPRIVWNISK